MKPVRERPGFTLIELLIVIGIIAVLMGIAIAVGLRVSDSGKNKSTKDLLLALDSIAAEAQTGNSGQVLPPLVADSRLFTNRNDPAATLWIPLADGRAKSGQNGGDNLMLNSAALFLWQARQYPAAAKLIESLPTKLMKVMDPDDPETVTGTAANESNVVGQPQLVTPMDAWGNPIRYVHPAFDGLIQGGGGTAASYKAIDTIITPPATGRLLFAEIRRNAIKRGDPTTDPALAADSDGGTCVGGRPYFYSAGPDGDPSTTSDNVYTTQPTLPKKQ